VHIGTEAQKSNESETLPLAPEFADLLAGTPEDDRHGRVFKLLGVVNPKGGPRTCERVTDPDWVPRIVARIGKAAGVVVNRRKKRDPKTVKAREVVKYASAHDLRRSFGTRWAYRVLPQVLQQLMRHERIETTPAYYVELEAGRTAVAVWEAWEAATAGNSGNTLGNTTPLTG
jgi:integrase